MRQLLKHFLLLAGTGMGSACFAEAERFVRVDAEGVLRWTDDASEVSLLGVNYYAPFSVDYAAIEHLGVDASQVIRDDVAHFKRLGLGCIRIHCFDREFSDSEGNFIDNQHVERLDFLIDECRRSGIYTVLTPIAWWGGHYAPGTTHGFSERYAMFQMTTDRQAWAIEARFLKQFVEHINRFTGKRYAEDPAVLAFECINEPLYPTDTPDSVVTAYINTLADALRSGGTTKPIYYNSWQGRNAAAAAARIDGVTGSNYPTGLASGRALKGSQLLRARGSSLQPDEPIAKKSRMIYEFDAADVPGSYMYPPMAKFFRSEGVQVASQFQYDSLPLAPQNKNWMTHHLNLVYTPGKALSLAIAAEVFKRVPRGAEFGTLPGAAVFPPFRSSGEMDLSEMVTNDVYLNSNTTETPAPDPEALRHVWGCGTSPIITYDGTGAYFLDRAAQGVWRLQLYPDVFTIADPYSGTDEIKVRTIPGTHPMTVNLPDLGKTFFVREFSSDSTSYRRVAKAKNGMIDVPPGDYLLTHASGLPSKAALRLALAAAPRYAAPPTDPDMRPLLRADVPRQWRAGCPLPLRAQAAFATNIAVRVTAANGQVGLFPMAASQKGTFTVEIPGQTLSCGVARIAFQAMGEHGTFSYPNETTLDIQWFPLSAPSIPLIRIPDQMDDVQRSQNNVAHAAVALVPGRTSGQRAVRLTADGFEGAHSAAGFTLPFHAYGKVLERRRSGIRILARGDQGGAKVELGFRMKNGMGLGCNLNIGAGWNEILVPCSELIPLWNLPAVESFHWEDVERVCVLTGTWLLQHDRRNSQGFDLAAVEWVPLQPAFSLTAADEHMPWHLFDAQDWARIPLWSAPLHRWCLVDDDGQPAIHLGVDSFGGAHDSVALRAACDGKSFSELYKTDGENAVFHVRARSVQPQTTGFELAFIQDDGVAWGTVVPLTDEWRTIRIPVRNLRLFTQWDATYAEKARPYLRLSKLQAINVCFGKWLFRETANEPHAFEIADIGVTEK